MDNEQDNIQVKSQSSSLGAFVKRRLPVEREVEEFDRFVENGIKDGEIEQSLEKIYSDGQGGRVDITKLHKQSMLTKITRALFSLFFVAVLIAGGLYGYYYFSILPNNAVNNETAQLIISAPEEVMAGEDYIYSIKYKNLSGAVLRDLVLDAMYPQNFVFIESLPPVAEDGKHWNLGSLAPGAEAAVKIKGKLVGKEDDKGILITNLFWSPVESSARFKKEEAINVRIAGVGVDFGAEFPQTVMIGEKNEFVLNWNIAENNKIDAFRIYMDPKENVKLLSFVPTDKNNQNVSVSEEQSGVWLFSDLESGASSAKIGFQVDKKMDSTENINFRLEYVSGEKTFLLKEQTANFAALKNDFNITLILNGSTVDKSINFGEYLNYALSYSNKGEVDLENVALMAVVDSGILDWSTLKMDPVGTKNNNTISWSARDISGLRLVESGDSGVINFSVKALSYDEAVKRAEGNYKVSSYVQFGAASSTSTPVSLDDARSNTIVARVNSDLVLSEQARYFSEDNIAVGVGPLPPKIGQTTQYRIYWRLSNTLHQLDNVKVKTILPGYINWVSAQNTASGKLSYDPQTREILWNVGKVSGGGLDLRAEFNINITPVEGQKGQVLMLLNGTKVEGYDLETNSSIGYTMGSKTTRLDDDEIGISDGVIE